MRSQTLIFEKLETERLKKRILNNIDRLDCWEWSKFRNELGYGLVSTSKGVRLVHRVSYTVFRGTIPENLLVLHTCDNPSCCNPDHLFLGNDSDNAQDCVKKGRNGNIVKSSRIRGHELGKKYGSINRSKTGKLWGRVNGLISSGAKILTDDDIKCLRSDIVSGVKRKVLLEKYGISKSQYHRIRRGDSYTDIL